MTGMPPPPARSATLSVTIDCPAPDVYAFLADAANWPRWAFINVLAIEPSGEPGWWKTTSAGEAGEIRIYCDAASGILDHDYRDALGGIWRMPARVVANGRGADFLMTFTQPAGLAGAVWENQLAEVQSELDNLRQVLERRPDRPVS